MMLPKRFIFGLISLGLLVKLTVGNESCMASIRGACPSPWIQRGGKCYKAVAETLSWFEAKEECIKMGGDLVVPESEDEVQFLMTLHSQFWIDCNDLHEEGSWVCQGMVRADLNWAPSEPNNKFPPTRESEECVMVWTALGELNDYPCDRPLHAICKRLSPQLHF